MNWQFDILHRRRIKFRTGNFIGVPIINFNPDWKLEIIVQFVRQTSSSEN